MKKHILRLTVALLALCLLCGCGKDAANPGSTTVPADTLPQTDPAQQQRVAMYEYLQNTLIPAQGLAKLEDISWQHSSTKGGVESNLGFLQEQGYWGILSAVVRDFDMDGNQDMVVFRLEGVPQSEIWAPIFNPDFHWLSYVISVDLYTLENGSICLTDNYPHLMTLDGLSWGPLTVALEQMEDGIYIQSWSSAEDYSTYGASPRSVFHIQDGQFVFDYLDGIRYGQASYDGDVNAVLGTTDLKPREYSLFDFEITPDQVDPAGDSRENRYVLQLLVKNDQDDYKCMHYAATDYTGLRIILDQGLDAFPHDPLPQGGKLPEDTSLKAYEPTAQAFIDHIIRQAGCEIVDSYASHSTNSGYVDFSWETAEASSILLRMNEDGNFLYIGLHTNEWKDLEDFISVKDAILDYPDLGLDTQAIQVFKGKVNSKYLNGYEVPGATLMMGTVADTMFRIYFE